MVERIEKGSRERIEIERKETKNKWFFCYLSESTVVLSM